MELLNQIRSLGFIFDSKLTLSNQILSVTKCCDFHLRRIRQLLPYLDDQARRKRAFKACVAGGRHSRKGAVINKLYIIYISLLIKKNEKKSQYLNSTNFDVFNIFSLIKITNNY